MLARFHAYRLGDIGLCSVVAAELACGVARSGSARNRQALEMFLAPLEILPFDAPAMWAYGELRADLERRGHQQHARVFSGGGSAAGQLGA